MRSLRLLSGAALLIGLFALPQPSPVLFTENFDESSLGALAVRWGDANTGGMQLERNGPTGGPSLRTTSAAGTNQGQLYHRFPGVDTLYVRYYINYAGAPPHHSGVWIGGYDPVSDWPDPQAGSKPNGDDRFIAAFEQQATGFNAYDYWMAMHPDGNGSYFGSVLVTGATTQPGVWACIEEMVSVNTPTAAYNGVQALWIDGVPAASFGQDMPTGTWGNVSQGQNPGIFTPSSSPLRFEGFRWRSTTALQLNWIWLQSYNPEGIVTVQFADLVASTAPIGCLTNPLPSMPTQGKITAP